jgi:signal transduction histidine kinase
MFPTHAKSIDEIKIDSLADTAWGLRETNPSTAYLLASETLIKSQKIGYAQGESYLWNIMGLTCRNMGEYKNAKKYFENALEIRINQEDSLGIASVYNNLGSLYNLQGKYSLALKSLFESEKIYSSFNRKDKLAIAYTNISNTYENEQNFEKALEFALKSLSIFEELEDSLSIASAIHNLGIIYFNKNDFFSSKTNLNKSIIIYKELNHWKGEADAHEILGQIAAKEKKLKDAEGHYEKALRIYEQNDANNFDKFTLFLNIGNFYYKNKQFYKGLNSLHKAKKTLGDKGGFEDRWLLNKNFSEMYEALSKIDSALVYKKHADSWKDSIYNAEKADALIKYEALFESEKRENKILEQDKKILQQDLESQKTKSQRNIFFSLLLVSLGVVIFSYIHFTQKQKATRTITQQNQKIHQQEIQELLKTQELTAINSMLEGQENERIRIAKDLHDRLGSILTTVKWSFDAYLEKQAPKQGTDPLIKAGSMLDDAYQEVRRIAHDMISGVLTKFGLVPALEELARTISTSGKMQVKVMSSGLGDRLENKVEITLYRVIQELLSNILKHANATEAIIQLTRLNGELNISVEDNGKGFDTEKIKYGMGIKNIEARLQALDGSFFIDSGKGNGTTVMIDLPV